MTTLVEIIGTSSETDIMGINPERDITEAKTTETNQEIETTVTIQGMEVIWIRDQEVGLPTEGIRDSTTEGELGPSHPLGTFNKIHIFRLPCHTTK